MLGVTGVLGVVGGDRCGRGIVSARTGVPDQVHPVTAALAIASSQSSRAATLFESGPLTGFRLSPVRPRDDDLVGLPFELTGVSLPPTFADLGVPADVVALLARDGITNPFPIQEATIPDALAGRDVSGRAPTGSGKTLAFAIALVEALGDSPSKARRPRGLVLVPTRELAAQVCGVLSPLARARRLSVAAVYGGAGYGPQLRALREAVDILVACPGRLEDLIERRDVSLQDVSIAVVDEADRMADMGFLPAGEADPRPGRPAPPGPLVLRHPRRRGGCPRPALSDEPCSPRGRDHPRILG